MKWKNGRGKEGVVGWQWLTSGGRDDGFFFLEIKKIK